MSPSSLLPAMFDARLGKPWQESLLRKTAFDVMDLRNFSLIPRAFIDLFYLSICDQALRCIDLTRLRLRDTTATIYLADMGPRTRVRAPDYMWGRWAQDNNHHQEHLASCLPYSKRKVRSTGRFMALSTVTSCMGVGQRRSRRLVQGPSGVGKYKLEFKLIDYWTLDQFGNWHSIFTSSTRLLIK